MTFHKIHNDMLNTGVADGQLPLIGSGNKLATALLDTGSVEGKIPVVGVGNKLPTSLLNVGNAANNIVQLDGTGKLPAIDGSLLTNIPAPVGVGSWDLLDTQVASNSAQIDLTNGIDGTYKLYKIIIESLKMGNDNNWPAMRVSQNGGTSFESSDYSYSAFRVDQSGTGTNSTPGGDTWIDLSGGTGFGNSAAETGFIEITINDPSNPSHYTVISWDKISLNSGGTVNRVIGGGAWKGGVQAVNAVRFIPQAGIISSGTFKLYGIS